MATERDADSEPLPGTVFNARQVRILKVVVIVLGLLLLGGFALLVGTIVYQASQLDESEGTGVPGVLTEGRLGELGLKAPAGTSIEGITLDGKRMAVHLSGPNGAEIAVIDVDKGRVIARIRLESE